MARTFAFLSVRMPSTLMLSVLMLSVLMLGSPPLVLPARAQNAPCMCSEFTNVALSTQSVGWVFRGHLRNGVFLPRSEFLRKVESDVERNNFFGTQELVDVVERASRYVDARMPGVRLSVGELSRRRGGNIMGHSSHESGRDVDLGFYLRDFAGVPIETPEFVAVNRAGIGVYRAQPIYFDDLRNWFLIEALLRDREVIVQHVFVARGLRRRLLRTAQRLGAPESMIERLGRVVMPPHADHPHDNHFHVRIYCPVEDQPSCRDRGPYWPWIPQDHPYASRVVPLPPLRF